MHKEIPNGPTPEQQPEEQVFSGEERREQFMKDHPVEIITPENRRECGPEIKEFEKMIDAFESKHSLAELHSIVGLTPEEAEHHPVRRPAQLAFSPMLKMLYILRDETDISPRKYKELKLRWNKIANAIGIINNNKLYHDRAVWRDEK